MCTYPHLSTPSARRLGCNCSVCKEYDRIRQERLRSQPGYMDRQRANERKRRQRPDVKAKKQAEAGARRSKYRTGYKVLTEEEKIRIYALYRKARELTRNTGIRHHVDHIIPLVAGGTHHPDNLQILTETQNIQKGVKISFAEESKIKKAVEKIIEHYGRVLEAFATGDPSKLSRNKRSPTLWD